MLPNKKVRYYMAEIAQYSFPFSTKPKYRPKQKLLNKQYERQRAETLQKMATSKNHLAAAVPVPSCFQKRDFLLQEYFS